MSPPTPRSSGPRSSCGRASAAAGLIPTALVADHFGPLGAGDRGEPVGRRHEPVPGVAAGRDDGVVVGPDPQAELVLAQVLPDVLDRVQLGAVARQRQEGEVLRDGEAAGRVPARPAPSSTTTACAPGATWRPISARCRPVASVLAYGRTSPAPTARSGQTAPNR